MTDRGTRNCRRESSVPPIQFDHNIVVAVVVVVTVVIKKARMKRHRCILTPLDNINAEIPVTYIKPAIGDCLEVILQTNTTQQIDACNKHFSHVPTAATSDTENHITAYT